MEIYVIEHPQVGPIHVRGVHENGKTLFSESTKSGTIVLSATPFYSGLTREQVLSLGGELVT